MRLTASTNNINKATRLLYLHRLPFAKDSRLNVVNTCT